MTSAVEKLELQSLENGEIGADPLLPRDMGLFGHVNVRLAVEIGQVELKIEKLLSSKAGEVLTLVQSVDALVTLLMNGKPIARGELVAVGDNFGVQITEIG